MLGHVETAPHDVYHVKRMIHAEMVPHGCDVVHAMHMSRQTRCKDHCRGVADGRCCWGARGCGVCVVRDGGTRVDAEARDQHSHPGTRADAEARDQRSLRGMRADAEARDQHSHPGMRWVAEDRGPRFLRAPC